MKKLSPQEKASKDLQTLPWIGPQMAKELMSIGMRSVDDVAQSDPEFMYEQLCIVQQKKVHRCVLYILRCIVYAASESDPNPELLKWWKWRY
jgi:hypothetical protein